MPPVLIALIIVAIFGVIVLGVILLKKNTKLFRNDEKPKTDKEIAAEELDRILQPIDDELVEKPAEPEEAPAAEEKKEDGEETPKE